MQEAHKDVGRAYENSVRDIYIRRVEGKRNTMSSNSGESEFLICNVLHLV